MQSCPVCRSELINLDLKEEMSDEGEQSSQDSEMNDGAEESSSDNNNNDEGEQ